jgi:hypothetical protein
VIPHRSPDGIPVNLLHSAERQALADHPGGDDWARACRDAAFAAIQSPDATFLRTFGLSSAALRRPRNLGERHINDPLGEHVLLELAAKQRGGR